MTLTAILAVLGFGKGRERVEYSSSHSDFADVGLQSLLELLIRFVISEEIRVGHEEGFAVVVGVDKPRGDVMFGSPDPLERISLFTGS